MKSEKEESESMAVADTPVPSQKAMPQYIGPMPCPLIKFPGDSTPYRARYLTWEQIEVYCLDHPEAKKWWK